MANPLVVEIPAAWPSARAQMCAVLRARGLQDADVDDVAQEVAVRVLGKPRSFDSEEHLVAWCCRVAINLHIDGARRQRFLDPEPPADVVGGQDTATTAEHRMALEALAEGIAQLSEEERRLLFDAEPVDSRREAVRLAVRRHRLRARLAALVEGMAAAGLFVRRFVRHLSRPAKVSLAAVPVVAAGLVLGPPTIGGRPPASAAPSSVPRAGSVTVSTARAVKTLGAGPVLPRPSSSTPRTPVPVTEHGAAVSSRDVVVTADPAGVPVRVGTGERPNGQPLVCTGGVVHACVGHTSDLPVPALPSRP